MAASSARIGASAAAHLLIGIKNPSMRLKSLFLSSFMSAFVMLVAGAHCAVAGDEDVIEVTVAGTLHAGVVAIGGETTGIVIEAKGITWELEFGKEASLRGEAERLHGQRVVVRGSLERRAGVEVSERWIVTVAALGPAAEAREGNAGDRGASAIRVSTRRGDSRVRCLELEGSLILDVTSGSGIGNATLRREAEAWPVPMRVRLHLKGLESFRVRAGDVTVEWSVSSTADQASRVSLHASGDEIALDNTSPYFTDARIVGGNGRIPLTGGYIEVPLPSRLFKDNPEEITIQWIDFYR